MKMGIQGLFFSWAKQSTAISLSLHKLFLFANYPLLAALYPYSWDKRGLNWFGGRGGASKWCEAVGVSNW